MFINILSYSQIVMSTTTATIFIGHTDPHESGIQPTHFIQFTENDRPALILRAIDDKSDAKVIIPSVENTIDDIYLMLAVFVLKKVRPSKEIHNLQRNSLYDILDEKERLALYIESKIAFQHNTMKLVFNMLEGCHLLNQLDKLKDYPHNFEVTTTTMKKKQSEWSDNIETKEI